MYLNGIGTAVPARRFTQEECWDAFQRAPQFPQLNPRSRSILRKVLSGDNGIASRHMVLPDWEEAFADTPEVLQKRFNTHAPRLATEAAQNALASARMCATDLDAILISTCTGYLCPGLTSYVNESLGMRSDVLALDLVGQGCGAAMPNLRTAEALLASGVARNVLSICVEICSAAFYLDNDPGVLISNCLFGDGAGAVVCSTETVGHARRLRWKSTGSILSPEKRDALRFEHRNGMLRNILGREVPEIAAHHVCTLLSEMLDNHPLERSGITGWILHAGGREVLSALQRQIDLSDEDVALSAGVLHEIGNVSSPFVLFVLERALTQNLPGGWWWMASFGAGFSCHGALLRVD